MITTYLIIVLNDKLPNKIHSKYFSKVAIMYTGYYYIIHTSKQNIMQDVCLFKLHI